VVEPRLGPGRGHVSRQAGRDRADTRSLFSDPRHPYTEALFSAAPVPDPTIRRKRIVLTGDIPSPINPPSGCAFRTRCPLATDACAQDSPTLQEMLPGRFSACIRKDLMLSNAP
jgi:oligopeptide transport system ATP-binding protein